MPKYPKRTGFKLTYDAECMYNDWVDVGGCTCFRCAPCRSCTHEGHYISLEENDEAWEIDEEEKDSRESCEGLYFKNVMLKPDGTVCSHFKPEFEYVIGGTVDGGSNGIYFAEGYGVLSACYHDSDNNVILQIEGEKPTKRWESSLKGEVKVVAKYTRDEFYRKFKKTKSDPNVFTLA